MLLLAHPGSACAAVRCLRVGAVRDVDGGLLLDWELDGDLASLRLPAAAEGVRADGLWRHTCFEAFIGTADAASYLEFNFSPSGAWAAYRFSGYREGMMSLDMAAPPRTRWERGPDRLRLAVSLPPLPMTAGALRLALCAVIEAASGTMSYWALRHPPGAPDFHQATGRVLELAPS